MSLEGNREAVSQLIFLSETTGISIEEAKIRRTSSRFCLGVEHGDYNGTELFGVGTNRFIWVAYKPNSLKRIRIFSKNFPDDGLIDFPLNEIPKPHSPEISQTWARFIFGVNYILQREGYALNTGMDALIYGNIPGGGMSRSASLSINLILSLLEVNNIKINDKFKIVDLAQAVETDYIGSPCGQLDQIMILFAKKGLGTHYNPTKRTVDHIKMGGNPDFRLVSLDTGTVRPGLEKSTYKIRRAECETFTAMVKMHYDIENLAEIKDEKIYRNIISKYKSDYPDLCSRLKYIYEAQIRFYKMIEAWKKGDIAEIGNIFRLDGFGLRDDYDISGPELETMCRIARSIDGVYGERMLGGGDKGASGAICRSDSIELLKTKIDTLFPEKYPSLKEKYSVHSLQMVDGVTELNF